MIPIRVLIIAEDMLARLGLTALLKEQDEVDIIGQIDGTHPVTQSIDLYAPDALLWDTGWHNMNANLGKALTQADLPILILLPDNDTTLNLTDFGLDDASLGYGILNRQTDAPTIATALRAITHGLIVLDASSLLNQSANITPALLENLTPREHEVLQLLAQGLTNKAIAHTLDITEHTVKYHVNAIMGKLDAQSRTDAVIKATRAGLISL